MRTITAFAALALLAGPALGQSLGEKTGVNSALGISPSTPDFVKQVAISDMFEIESSKLAVQRADGPTKDFANHMVTDHTKTSSELKELVAGDASLPIPAAMDDAHQSKLKKLQGLNGGDFAEQYHDDQVEAHEDAVSLFQRYSSGGDNEKLKAWATKTLPALQAHLDKAKTLDK